MRLPVFFWYVLLLLCFPLYYWLNYETTRDQFDQLMLLFTALFGIYGYLVFISDKYYGKNIGLTAGILFRLLVVFSLPMLSDDYYRFIWDGRMTLQGISPYADIPANIEHHDLMLSDMYHLINSQEYFTVYPPANQFFFWLANLTGDKVTTITISMKAFILMMEVCSIFIINDLLRRFNMPTKYTLIYALNPLVIIEFTASLHFEAAMIFFLLLAFWLIQKKMIWLSSLAFAMAICSKILPVIFLPFIIPLLGWKKGGLYTITTLLFCLLSFIPFWEDHLFWNILESLKLYFGQFEFNSSIYKLFEPYYTVRWVPSLLFIIFYAWFWFKYQQSIDWKKIMPALLAILSVYFLCASTVHPWYIATLMVFACFSVFKYPIVWSAMLPLTYITYIDKDHYLQQHWVNVVEYVFLVIIVLFEFFIQRKNVLETPEKAA